MEGLANLYLEMLDTRVNYSLETKISYLEAEIRDAKKILTMHEESKSSQEEIDGVRKFIVNTEALLRKVRETNCWVGFSLEETTHS